MGIRYKGRVYTGKGVSIAVIDSGVNRADPRLDGVDLQGWRVRLRATNHVVIDDYFHDKVGHGTDMAAAIVEEAPDASIVSIRIMDDEFKASADLMSLMGCDVDATASFAVEELMQMLVGSNDELSPAELEHLFYMVCPEATFSG